jgi:hypothetical protein
MDASASFKQETSAHPEMLEFIRHLNATKENKGDKELRCRAPPD